MAVWLYNATLVAAAAALYVLVLPDLHWDDPIRWWHWILLGGASLIADNLQVHLRIERDAYSLSLSEIPVAVGLATVAPPVLLVARVLATVGGLVAHGTRSPTKAVFNLALVVIETIAALWLFDLIRSDAGGAVYWREAFIATFVPQIAAQAAVLLVLKLHRLSWHSRIHVLFPIVGAVINTTMGSIAVLLLTSDPVAGVLMLMVGTFVAVLAYRSYNRLREQHESLSLLQDLTHAVDSSFDQRTTTRTLLQETRRLLRAETAEIVLLNPEGGATCYHLDPAGGEVLETPVTLDPVLDRLIAGAHPLLATRRERRSAIRRFLAGQHLEDAVVAPLKAPSTNGAVIVGNRLGDNTTFAQHDLRLLQTVADHARVLLENGRLVHQLRQEIADKEHQASHDALTGLANRAKFSTSVAEAINASGTTAPLGVMLLDLDRFKEVNDTLGHHVGDLLLTQVAERLQRVLRDVDVIARLGGDEFCVLLVESDIADCLAVAERAQEALERPFQLAGLELFVGASIGLAMYPEHADRPELLLQRADVAMYAAKRASQSCVVYETGLDEHSHQSLALAAELRSALDTRLLQVHYQPKSDVATGRTVGVEALVRWFHPERGFVPPDEFIPLAEHTGLINPLTEQVFDQVFAQLQRWHEAGQELNAAVNVSAGTILATDFVDGLQTRITAAGLPPQALTLEITESQVMADPERAAAVLQALRDIGVRISIDDFGTGYSSLSQLKRLPVDELKIDRSFVFGMTEDSDDAVIVRSTVELAHNLGLEVVAEGVEDVATWDELARLGCDLAQGYYLSRPLPPEDLTAWLHERQAPVPA